MSTAFQTWIMSLWQSPDWPLQINTSPWMNYSLFTFQRTSQKNLVLLEVHSSTVSVFASFKKLLTDFNYVVKNVRATSQKKPFHTLNNIVPPTLLSTSLVNECNQCLSVFVRKINSIWANIPHCSLKYCACTSQQCWHACLILGNVQISSVLWKHLHHTNIPDIVQLFLDTGCFKSLIVSFDLCALL